VIVRPNNPGIDFARLNERVCTLAARLREAKAVEENRRHRADEVDASPELALARYRAVNALLDRAEDLNQPKQRLPRKLAALHRLGPRSVRFALRTFNYIFRNQRDVNDAQIQAMRELSQATLAATQRVYAIERELERLRSFLEHRDGDA
jgi:hypothetical protein